ncbi:MAG: hypothetical protein UHM56_01700 [Phascolarctobacterium sp.]|nr:hypothetical protein [Phascolarctobacterium sp.]
MTFYEKLVEKAKEMGYPSATKFFDAAEVNTNARLALKKTGRLSDTYKMRVARVLKCSVGDINRMMSEAQADALKKDWPEKVKCSPSKPEAELAPEPEPIPVPEPEPVPEAEPLTEDQILEEKIEEIKAKADVLLTYHDRIKGMAETVLAKEYTEMLRKQMLFVAVADLTDLCREFTEKTDTNKAAAFVDVASEILKLKEGE